MRERKEKARLRPPLRYARDADSLRSSSDGLGSLDSSEKIFEEKTRFNLTES